MNNTPVMPRRRGSLHNSATRRAATSEDARNGGKTGAAKGNRKSSMTNHKEAVTTEVATTPAPLSAANKSGAMAAAGVALMTNHVTGVDSPATNPPDGTDSGYLHKKFKKVAAAVMRDEPESGIHPAGRTPPPVICSGTSSASQVAPESTPMVQNESRQTTATTGAANLPANQKALDNGPTAAADVTTPSAAGGTGRTKSGRYVCPYCQHACAKPSVLEKHIRAHTNERPYPCVPCGFAFKTKSNLYKHCKSRTHVLKVEESGGADPTAAQSTDAGSDTSDDMSNMNEGQDSDDVDGADAPTASASGNNNNISSNNNNVPLADAVPNGLAESSTTPEKFKTPYKPKFHVFKPSEDGAPLAPGTVPVSTEERSDANSVNCDSAHFGASSGTSSGAACRPQLASLQARISQIISENQAIVETKDPIWPRRYVRQSSRDKDSNYAASGANTKIKVSGPTSDVAGSALTSSPAVIHQRISLNRERSSSLSLVDPSSLDLSRSALTVSARSLGPSGSPSRNQTFSPNHAPPAPSGVTFTPKLIHHVEAEEMHRKRCYSEGPENAMRHSVRHILQPIPALSSQTKVARSEPASAPVDAGNPTIRPESYPSALAHPTSLHPQNPEGSIIKDLLLKSRGLLGSGDAKEADVPAKVTSSSSSSFSVSALLNSSTSARSSSFSYQQMAAEASRSAPEMDEAEGNDERPSKKAKLSPELPIVIRPVDLVVSASGAYGGRNPLPLSGDDQLNRRTPTRSSSLQLFGGEVEICDGHQRTVMRIDPGGFTPEAPPSAQSSAFSSVTGSSSAGISADSISSSIVVTISKSGLNSGGGVVQVQNREPPPRPTPLPLNISFDCATSTSASGNEDRSSGVIVKSGRNKAESDSLVLSMGVASSSSLPVNLKSQIHQVPYVPGIPGPYSLSNWLPHDSVTTVTAARAVYSSAGSHVTTTTSIRVPQITINPPCSSGGSPLPPEEVIDVAEETDVDGSDNSRSMKFLRPNSLPLKPGTFQLKKSSMAGLDVVGAPNMVGSGGGVTLISPETPRPRKLYRQTYLNGHAYTYLGLKCSTRVYYCCLSRSQPMYVIQCDPKLSMYSQWKIRPCAADSSPLGVGPVEAMSLYDSRHRPASYSTAQSRDGMRMILTHSSYWTNRDRPTSANVKPEVCTTPAPPLGPATLAPLVAEDDKNNVKPLVVVEPEKKVEHPEETKTETTAAPVPARPPDGQPKRVRIFAGGFKSNEDYTYVRGRGRGRYVCEECGIRCKKPSMLKKHIRTHTDLRPYTCRQCNFSFKTKGNLTKHMKSKAHHKKCTELGIVPVPTTVEEANIDEDSLARQETLKKLCGSKSDPDSELDEDDDDDDEEEDEDGEEEEEEVDFNDGTPEISGQFEDASEADVRPEANRSVATAVRGEREQEVARSLLDLGVLAPAGSKPTTYPYVMHWNTPDSGKEVPPNGPEESKLMETSNDDKPFPIPEALPPLPQPPQPPPQQASGPMDLSTTRSVKENPSTPTVAISNEILSPVTQPSSLLASIYLTAQKVQEASVRRSLESPNESSDTHSGMLQAYLTEKALKEGLMKSKQQIKEIAASGPSAAPTTPAVLASPQAEVKSSEARPNVIHPPSTSTNRSIFGESMTVSGVKGRPEVFVVPSTSSSTSSASSASSLGGASAYKLTDDGKTACSICNKVFTKPSQLRLHINIHYFERPFRCEACAVSFRTKGHLQKHKRSVTHFNKVNMNLTFGTPSSENPRPFKCSDCMIAFRIHGHLAKHLRSKMHIMKLECLGKLPFGTYAEMERSGINLNEIDTTDCHNSLESLQSLAHRLYKQDPSKLQQWQQEQAQGAAEANMRERTISGSSEEFSDAADMDGDDMDEDGEDSDGLPDAVVESIPHQTPHHPPQPPHQSYHHPTRKGEPDLSEPREASYSIREEPAGRSEAHHHHLATSQPTQVSPPLHYAAPDPARAPPVVYCPACGEACSSNEAFQLHFMEKHRPLPAHPHSGPAPFAPSSAKEVIRSPSPMEASPQPVRPLELTRNSTGPPPDVRRDIEYERSPPRPAEAKLAPNPPSHWNRNSELASSYNQRPVYYHPGNGPPPPPAGLPPHSALPMWPRPPSGYGEFINPLSTMPPHWHQDPAAMAWIHHRLMMPMPPSGAPHPHNYMTSGHLAHGVNGTRLNHSPSTSNSNAVHSEELVFTCDICGKTCNSKDSLHQHMLAHAQPRPFVCEHCDAGFTTQQHLESHLVLHRPRTS